MHTRAIRPSRALAVLVGISLTGCYREARHGAPIRPARSHGPPQRVEDVEAVGPAMPETIRIDRTLVGAVPSTRSALPPVRPTPRRRLAFQVTGFGVEPETGSPVERKNAALEAAVVDAMGRAAREIQRDPKTNRTPVEYRLRISPSLTIFGQLVSGAPQTVVMLTRRGRIIELCARNGVLAHPPHDTGVIQRVFAAADGWFVLHGTRATGEPGRYSASVGYYRANGASATSRSTSMPSELPAISVGQ